MQGNGQTAPADVFADRQGDLAMATTVIGQLMDRREIGVAADTGGAQSLNQRVAAVVQFGGQT